MKKNKFSALTLALVVLCAGCQKDIHEDALAAETNTVGTTTIPPPVLSAWTTVDKQAKNAGEVPVSYNNIEDTAISTDVLENGLVLVFAKMSGATRQLPFIAENAEWYYEISAGSISITSKAADKQAAADSQSVQYIVFSSTQLSELSNNGISKDQLINLSYEKAVSLFKQS